MPKASVGDVELYYEEHGQGPALLLLMGFGDDCSAWSGQVPAFATRYRTILCDHRGVGGSDVPASGYSIPQFADDALRLLDHLDVPRAHVVGYSMGGRVAQHLAAHRPDRVAGLVLVATAARANPLNLYSLRASAYLYERFGPEAAGAFGPLISFSHAYFQRHLHELLRGLGRPAARSMPIHAYLGHVSAIETHDTSAVLGRIRARTLVVLGDQEWLNPLPDAEQLVDGIPGARLLVLPGAGHGLLWEIPEAFNAAVLDFLAGVPT